MSAVRDDYKVDVNASAYDATVNNESAQVLTGQRQVPFQAPAYQHEAQASELGSRLA